MSGMNTKSWYTNADRTKVTWATAVVAGVAKTDIYELRVPDGHQISLVWAKTGQAVSDEKLAGAKKREETGAVPAEFVPTSGRGSGSFKSLAARITVLEAKP